MSARRCLFFTLVLASCSAGTTESTQPTSEPTTTEPQPTSQPTADATSAPTSEPQAKVCTRKTCSSVLDVELHPGAAGWTKGKYSIELTAGAKKATCDVELPLPACDKGKSAKCTGDIDVMVMEYGCDKPPAEHAISGLHFTGTPAEVNFVMKKNKQKFLEADLRPKYKTVKPNGEGCDPVCNIAEEKVCKEKCP